MYGPILECVLHTVKVVMTCKVMGAVYFVASYRADITCDHASFFFFMLFGVFNLFRRSYCLSETNLIPCCRSCEKMNVVKENKDLACFYTTKHSWRGK